MYLSVWVSAVRVLRCVCDNKNLWDFMFEYVKDILMFYDTEIVKFSFKRFRTNFLLKNHPSLTTKKVATKNSKERRTSGKASKQKISITNPITIVRMCAMEGRNVPYYFFDLQAFECGFLFVCPKFLWKKNLSIVLQHSMIQLNMA